MYCECLLPQLRSQFRSDSHLTGHRDLHFVKQLGIFITNIVETIALLSRFPLKYKIIKVCEVNYFGSLHYVFFCKAVVILYWYYPMYHTHFKLFIISIHIYDT